MNNTLFEYDPAHRADIQRCRAQRPVALSIIVQSCLRTAVRLVVIPSLMAHTCRLLSGMEIATSHIVVHPTVVL